MIKRVVIFLLMYVSIIKLPAQSDYLQNSPKIDFSIKLNKDTFKANEDIQIEFLLRNNTSKAQSVIFDRPKSTTGAPAFTFVSLIDRATGKSVLKYGNKRVLESQIYSEEQLKDSSYYLEPGALIKRKFSLFDLAVTSFSNYGLKEGRYELQIYYCTNQSNRLRFTIR